MMKLTDTQKKLAEQLLLTVINHESVVEYNELAIRINPPMFWRQVGREIGEVSKLCKELGLPLLSAKVVGKSKGVAGSGFYSLMKQLGIDTKGKTEKELLHQELVKIRECKEWYKLADYLNLNLNLPRPFEKNDVNITVDLMNNSKENITIKKETTKAKAIPSTKRWIIPSDSNGTFDIFGAYQKFSEIDWRKNANYQVGDIIYIYCSKPYQKIMFQVEVVQIDIPFTDTIDDSEFWIDLEKYKDAQERVYARLKFIKGLDTDLLSLDMLILNGMKIAPRGPIEIEGRLKDYIESCFKQSIHIYDGVLFKETLPEELSKAQSEILTEGAKKQIVVNAYERNIIARNKCIRIHGSKCVICGFDFENFYGSDFKGKIHVHHIKPLHKIDDTYIVDPEKDLVPVCPNCHMVLHSKRDDAYTIEEVKQMINRKG